MLKCCPQLWMVGGRLFAARPSLSRAILGRQWQCILPRSNVVPTHGLVPVRHHLGKNGQLAQMQQVHGQVRNSVVHSCGRAFFLGRQESRTSGLVASDLARTCPDCITSLGSSSTRQLHSLTGRFQSRAQASFDGKNTPSVGMAPRQQFNYEVSICWVCV